MRPFAFAIGSTVVYITHTRDHRGWVGYITGPAAEASAPKPAPGSAPPAAKVCSACKGPMVQGLNGKWYCPHLSCAIEGCMP